MIRFHRTAPPQPPPRAIPAPPPPLLVFVDRPLPNGHMQQIRDLIEHAIINRKPIVFDPRCTVYQLIDGRWERIEKA